MKSDPESEFSLIGALTFAPAMIGDMLETLRPEHFWNENARLIWAQLKSDFIARRDIDLTVLGSRLTELGLWERVKVTFADGLVPHYAPTILPILEENVRSLERCRLLREAEAGLHELATAVEDGNLDASRTATNRLQERLSETRVVGGHDIASVYREVVNETGDVQTMGIPMGFQWLDAKTGGLTPGSLIVVAAPRGGGKSALVTQIAWECALAGHFTGIYSLEMLRREIFHRICCLEGVRSTAWLDRKFNKEELGIISKIGESKASLRIYDELYKIEDISARIRLDVARFKLRVAIVDYIQRVKGDKKEGREREVSGVAWELKQLANTLGITILAPSQLNGDLQARESRDIENHADKMFIIARSQKEDEDDNGRRLLKITKNRNGPSDIRCLYQFHGVHFRFDEHEETTADVKPAKSKRSYHDDQ